MSDDRRLFVYGTQLDPELFEAVTGLTHQAAGARPARLKGFRRVQVRGEVYPTLLRAPAGVIEGLVVGPLAEDVMARLRTYEGEPYRLEPVTVETEAGPAAALVWLTDAASASMTPWRLEAWQRRAKAAALAGLRPHRAAAPPDGHGALPRPDSDPGPC